MNEIERGVQLGIQLAARHCDFNAKQHKEHDRQLHADALCDEADNLRALALNHKKYEPLVFPEPKDKRVPS